MATIQEALGLPENTELLFSEFNSKDNLGADTRHKRIFSESCAYGDVVFGLKRPVIVPTVIRDQHARLLEFTNPWYTNIAYYRGKETASAAVAALIDMVDKRKDHVANVFSKNPEFEFYCDIVLVGTSQKRRDNLTNSLIYIAYDKTGTFVFGYVMTSCGRVDVLSQSTSCMYQRWICRSKRGDSHNGIDIVDCVDAKHIDLWEDMLKELRLPQNDDVLDDDVVKITVSNIKDEAMISFESAKMLSVVFMREVINGTFDPDDIEDQRWPDDYYVDEDQLRVLINAVWSQDCNKMSLVELSSHVRIKVIELIRRSLGGEVNILPIVEEKDYQEDRR